MKKVMMNWHFPRHALADAYLNQFAVGITHAMTLFAPRRYGKTEFLLFDLCPLAEEKGYRVVYASMWASRTDPLMALLYALNEAVKPNSLTERIKVVLNTPVKSVELEVEMSKLGKAKAAIDFTDKQFTANLLLDINTRLDDLIKKASPGRVLLLLDEVQYLAKPQYEDLVAALRTSLDLKKGKVAVVYTGSSRVRLQRMFDTIKAPLFHSSQMTNFPELDKEFVGFMLSNFEKVTGRKIALNDALMGFDAVSKSPGLFREAIESVILTNQDSMADVCKSIVQRADEGAGYEDQWLSFKDIDRSVIRRVIAGNSLFTAEACKVLAAEIGTGKLTPQQVQICVNRLEAAQVLLSKGKGKYEIEDPRFVSWISRSIE